jgi:dipeptidase E
MRGVFVGSGSDGLQHKDVTESIVSLVNKPPSDINVAYIGTATYDLPGPRHNQTFRLAEAGCNIMDINCTHPGDTTMDAMANIMEQADVAIVSGGNTLFAHNRWVSSGLASLLKTAADRGVVLAGGSAGAICWFTAGHSDSADPETYKAAMLGAASEDKAKDEASEAPAENEEAKTWKYIRVPCLSFFPGLVCPHADSTQSNGVLRMTDFDEMMLRHSNERGITIDHWAALVVDGEDYNVLELSGKPGSVMADGSWNSDRQGLPGVWVKEVEEGAVKTILPPTSGKLADLLRLTADGDIVDDPNVRLCEQGNPFGEGV